MSHLQNILNKAYQHFVIERNPPAAEILVGNYIGNHIGCSYFNEKTGRKCAIGLSFDDETCAFFNNEGSFGDIVLHVEREQIPDENHGNMFEEIKREVRSIFNINSEDEEDDNDLIKMYLDDFQKKLHDDLISKTTGDWISYDTLENSYIHVAKVFNLTIPESPQ